MKVKERRLRGETGGFTCDEGERRKISRDLRCSLVCLVAVPDFDSSFDETDHVFILNKRAGGVRGGEARANTRKQVPSSLGRPHLKEGECCPLQETLSVANLSVKLL